MFLSCVISFTVGDAFAYTYNASDFATSIIDYTQGTSVGKDWLSGEWFNNTTSALGRPTVDTTGDNWYIPASTSVPVVSAYPAFRSTELITIGNGGSLTVMFDHKVQNDPNNPYGLDLIIYGNAFQSMNGQGWTNGDPSASILGSTCFTEAGTVSVSQNGIDWYTFSNSYADTFAPTLGRVYDTDNPDTSIGDWNLWWGAVTDPTLPLDPDVTSEDLAGLTVAEAAILYGNSAGGTAFDIGILGLDWVQYVRVSDLSGSSWTSEIDAFADVSAVPEPASCILMGLGGGLLAWRRRRSIGLKKSRALR
jgi:hypothetical protein